MAEMKVWYDREGDYLGIIFEDAPATMEEIGEDVFERRFLLRQVQGSEYAIIGLKSIL
jgi:hypothetical protein